jgi:hypothetical protein
MPEETNCKNCCEKDKIIENMLVFKDEYKRKKGGL